MCRLRTLILKLDFCFYIIYTIIKECISFPFESESIKRDGGTNSEKEYLKVYKDLFLNQEQLFYNQ